LSSSLCLLGLFPPMPAPAQERPVGHEVGALPALNYDSDEGFGYGALAELYYYGDGSVAPYRWTIQPMAFLTTEGRRNFTVFFDSPGLLPDSWRFDVFLGSEKQIATPYYGIGNDTPYDETLDDEDGPNPYFYRFGPTRRSGGFGAATQFYAFPEPHWTRLRTTNGLERLHAAVKRRIRAVGAFPDRASALRLITAVALRATETWASRRYPDVSLLEKKKAAAKAA